MSVFSLGVLPEDMLRECLRSLPAVDLALLWTTFDRRLQRSMARIVKTILLEPGEINDNWHLRAFLRWLGKAETLIVTRKLLDGETEFDASKSCAFSPNSLKITLLLNPSKVVLECNVLVPETERRGADLVSIEARLDVLFPHVSTLVCKMISVDKMRFPTGLTDLEVYDTLDPQTLIFVWSKLPVTMRRLALHTNPKGSYPSHRQLVEKIGHCRFYRFASRFPRLEELDLDDQLMSFVGLGTYGLEEDALLQLRRTSTWRARDPRSDKGSELWEVDWTLKDSYYSRSFATFEHLHSLSLVISRARDFKLCFPPELVRLSLRIMDQSTNSIGRPFRRHQRGDDYEEEDHNESQYDAAEKEEIRALTALLPTLPKNLTDLTLWFTELRQPTLSEIQLLPQLPKGLTSLELRCEKGLEAELNNTANVPDLGRSKGSICTDTLTAYLPQLQSISLDGSSIIAIWNDPQPAIFVGPTLRHIELTGVLVKMSWVSFFPEDLLSIVARFDELDTVLALFKRAPKCHATWTNVSSNSVHLPEIAQEFLPPASTFSSNLASRACSGKLAPLTEISTSSLSTRISEIFKYRLKASFEVRFLASARWETSSVTTIDASVPEPEKGYCRRQDSRKGYKPPTRLSARLEGLSSHDIQYFKHLTTLIATLPIPTTVYTPSVADLTAQPPPLTTANPAANAPLPVAPTLAQARTLHDEPTEDFPALIASPKPLLPISAAAPSTQGPEVELSPDAQLVRRLPASLTYLDLLNTALTTLNTEYLPVSLTLFRCNAEIATLQSSNFPAGLSVWETPKSTFSWSTLLDFFTRAKQLKRVAFGQPSKPVELEDHDLLRISAVAWKHIEHVRAELDYNTPLRLTLTGMLIPHSTASVTDWATACHITQDNLFEPAWADLPIFEDPPSVDSPASDSPASDMASSSSSSTTTSSSSAVDMGTKTAKHNAKLTCGALITALENWIVWEDSWQSVRWRTFPANARSLNVYKPRGKLASRSNYADPLAPLPGHIGPISEDMATPSLLSVPRTGNLPSVPRIPPHLTDFSSNWKDFSKLYMHLPSTVTSLNVTISSQQAISWEYLPSQLCTLSLLPKDDSDAAHSSSGAAMIKQLNIPTLKLDSLPPSLVTLKAPSLNFDISGLKSVGSLKDLQCFGSNFTMADVRSLLDLGLKNVATTGRGRNNEAEASGKSSKKKKKR